MVRPSRTGGKTSEAKIRKSSPAKGHEPTKAKRRSAPTASRVERRSVSGPSKDLKAARKQQAATAEILKVIASSPNDVQPVVEAVAERAMSLLDAWSVVVTRFDGELLRFGAARGALPDTEQFLRNQLPDRPEGAWFAGRSILQRSAINISDALADPSPQIRDHACMRGFRAALSVPMLRDGQPIGAITVTRREAGAFAANEVELLQTFADQAVISIENTRLFNETEEVLERQSATADILKVIASSPSNVQPVFEAIAESAKRLLGSHHAVVTRVIDDTVHLAAFTVGDEEGDKALQSRFPMPLSGPGPNSRAARTGEIERVTDTETYLDSSEDFKKSARARGFRSVLVVPMLRNGVAIGTIATSRRQPGSFADKEIDLLRTFADQAVIAIENARLFEELRDRQADLARSVDELTATGDVLKIISRSSIDLETVLDTLVETVARLCRTDQTLMFRRHDDKYHLVAACGLSAEAKVFIHTHPLTLDRGSVSGRVALERRAVHIYDVLQDPEYTYSGQKVSGARTILGVPLLREDALVGIFTVHRTRVDPFTDKEIELVTTFADQAVIAIENARLFEELRERQAELRVTFDNMGDGVVMFGADTRLVAWNRNFQEMLDLPDAFLGRRPSYAEYFRYLADRGEYSADLEADLRRLNEDPWQALRLERTRPDGRVIEVRRNSVPGGGFVLIYSDITERKRAEEAIRAARDAAEMALRELQTAQASLVHAQKMAALGQVTAGIAHEIKNPLNFVNNFAGLSVELLDELKDAAARSVGAPDPSKRTEIAEIIGMLTGNLEKIVEHGRRADGIVRSMLQHSRGSSDDWQSTDLNALAEEALNLAYHGARAQDPNFDIALERDLDRNLAPVDVVPQELTRVLLNLIGNGFYAAAKRSVEGDGTFRPALKVTTREFGESVEVRVRDNGVGIPAEDYEKLFQPFFTTKPTGEGTGLGLSISYEIVTQQHGGTITVDSEVGDFAEFTVRLPRRGRAVAG